jgi:hypothetical protein
MEAMNIDQLNILLGDKEHAYQILVYKGYNMPEATSRIISKDYIMDVLSKSTWCPMKEGMKILKSLSSPTSCPKSPRPSSTSTKGRTNPDLSTSFQWLTLDISSSSLLASKETMTGLFLLVFF